MQTFKADELCARVERIFRAAGASEREARLIAEQLVEANLCGHDSHGVGMVARYLENARDGTLRLGAALEVALDTGAMVICDAGLGAGQVMGRDALALGLAHARKVGACVVSLRNSHHLGRIGHWAEMCAAEGLVSVHFVNVVADPVVALYGGTRARLGTNPFAAGFPVPGGGEPIVVDFATSRLALGKIRVAWEKGEDIAPGTLIDAAGRPTIAPATMFEPPIGALLPFGEHKGGGLALACELLGAAIVGAPVQSGPATSTAIINSMLSVLLDPSRLATRDAYAAQLDAVRRWVLSENEEGGSVMLPGMPEQAARERRSRHGIPLNAATTAQLASAERRLGLAPEERQEDGS